MAADPATKLVDLQQVGHTFPGPPEVVALREATLTVDEGEYVALMGASGSGKSTLLNILGLLSRPTAGSYRLRGKDVGRLSERERAGVRAHWIGTVFQAFHLLSDRSVTENVMMGALYGGARGRDRELRTRAAELLAQVGLPHRSDAMPNTLSGGEKQRAAIARALVTQPQLLLCDEPTGNLDSHSSTDVLDLFDGLNSSGQTLIVITHSADVASRAGRILRMRDGVVMEDR